MKKIIFILLFCFPVYLVAQSGFRLPSIISDHAVLASNSQVKLWGWAPGSSKVRVVCDWSFWDTVTVVPDRDCSWEAVIRTPQAGEAYSIRFFNENNKLEKEIKDILIGQVWLCSGQSNMEQNAHWRGILDANDDYVSASNNKIRFFQIYPVHSKNPLDNCYGEWKICDEKTAKDFSAVGYFFGRRLNEQLKVPVGLIGSSWGGTCIQAWTPQEVYINNSRLGYLASKINNSWNPVENGVIYNAMIHPLTNYYINGAIWYQGEANNEEPSDYGDLLKGLIQGWRRAFNIHFPFYYVQIAPWAGYQGINGALLREQQENALSLSKTGMVCIGDLVDDINDIHPKLKKGVGVRLANMALKETYGEKDLQSDFPSFEKMECHGNKAKLSFRSYGKLAVKGNNINNFQLAAEDKVFYPAKAVLQKNGKIVLSSGNVKKPAHVRYCFTNEAMPELFDINGLPLKPFRTDKPDVLKFNDQRFRIIQFTDLHWNCAPQFDLQNDSTETLIRTLVTEEKPDLIVFTGDVVVEWDAIKAWTRLSNILEDLKVPFVVTFGNHDIETNMKTEDILKFLQQNPYNLTYNASETISGIGNCVIPVKDSDGVADVTNLFFFDSNAYTGNEMYGFYDWIKEDQIHWYRRESDRILRENRRVLPAMAFFHIPVPEYEIVRNSPNTIGNKHEAAGSPVLNSGLFTSFIEKKNVMAVFAGHEHNNDFIGSYADINLAYGRKSGYIIAYEEILPRGARLIEMKENKRAFTTYIRTLNEKLFEYNYER